MASAANMRPGVLRLPDGYSYLNAALQALSAVNVLQDVIKSSASASRRPKGSLTELLAQFMLHQAGIMQRASGKDLLNKLISVDSYFAQQSHTTKDASEALDIIIDVLIEEDQMSTFGRHNHVTGPQRYRFSRFSPALTRSRANVEAMRYRMKQVENKGAAGVNAEGAIRIYVRRTQEPLEQLSAEDDDYPDEEMPPARDMYSNFSTTQGQHAAGSFKDLVLGSTALRIVSDDSGARYSTASQPFTILDVPPVVNQVAGLASLKETLASLTRRRAFDGQGQEWCRLSRHWFNLSVHEGSIQVEVDIPPRVLVIKLDRLQRSHSDPRAFVKIRGHMKFDVALDLAPYTIKPLPNDEASLMYDLKAVVVHDDRSDHQNPRFLTIVKTQGSSQAKWYALQGSSAQQMPESKVLEQEAYMLVYESRSTADMGDYVQSHAHPKQESRYAHQLA